MTSGLALNVLLFGRLLRVLGLEVHVGRRLDVLEALQCVDLSRRDANPFENSANSRRIAGVMLRGRWFSREDVRALLRPM